MVVDEKEVPVKAVYIPGTNLNVLLAIHFIEFGAASVESLLE